MIILLFWDFNHKKYPDDSPSKSAHKFEYELLSSSRTTSKRDPELLKAWTQAPQKPSNRKERNDLIVKRGPPLKAGWIFKDCLVEGIESSERQWEQTEAEHKKSLVVDHFATYGNSNTK